jgi:outer membrane protein insertion porin family
MPKIHIFICLSALCLLLSACNPTHYLAKEESFLQKNTYTFPDLDNIEQARQWEYELNSLARQKPNSRLLVVAPFRMWLYMAGARAKNKEARFNQWLLTKAGERPVASDSFLLKRSAISMQNYLRNEGYYTATVEATRGTAMRKFLFLQTKTPEKGRVNHNYTVKLGDLYKIDTVKYDFDNQDMQELLRETKTESFIKKGAAASQKNIENERKRMSRLFKNNGFFYFSPGVIEFEGDSLAGSVVQLSIKIDSAFKYQPLKVHDVKVFTDIHLDIEQKITEFDTIINYKGISFLEKKPFFIHRKILERAFYFEKDGLFKIDEFDKTLKRLRELGVYRFTEIRFEPNKTADSINCVIRLTPAKRMDTRFDFDIRNALADNAGIGGAVAFTFLHKNLFKGAEQFNFTIEPGLEARPFGVGAGVRSLLFRTQAGLLVPRLLVPFKINDGNLRNRANTRFDLNYSYQDLDGNNFKSRIFGLSAGYDWYETNQKRHQYMPLNIAFQNIEASSELINGNQYLQRTFEPRLLVGSNYNFTYNALPKPNGFSWSFKGGLDMAGDIPYLLNKWTSWDGKVFNTPYSQFAKIDTDFRFYKKLTRRTQFAARTAIGIAAPYGKTQQEGNEIPFGKQFSIGGANSIRAWNIRKLGAGSDISLLRQDNEAGYQTGDSKLELSAEYRFDIFEYFKGAVFMDAGNIWNSRSDKTEAHFKLDQFANQLAIGTGFGLRLDFSYFILRADLGWAVRYPYLQKSEYSTTSGDYKSLPNSDGTYWRKSTWDTFFKADWRSPQFNLALGYPF